MQISPNQVCTEPYTSGTAIRTQIKSSNWSSSSGPSINLLEVLGWVVTSVPGGPPQVAVSSAITQNLHVFLGFDEALMISSIDEIKFLARDIEWQDGLLLGDVLDKLSKGISRSCRNESFTITNKQGHRKVQTTQ
jgi:hypothetical protein